MKVNFVKMNSQGNDFIIIDATNDSVSLTSTQIQEISSRSNIGCDQLLILDIQNSDNVACKIYNSDASEALQCGNGMRAIMFFLNKYYKYEKATIIVGGAKYFSTMNSSEIIKVNMGLPTFLQDKTLETSAESKIDDDAFWSQSKFSNIWAIQHGTSVTSDEVEYRDETPHGSFADANIGAIEDFTNKWDASHLVQLQSAWDADDRDESEKGPRPTSYSS